MALQDILDAITAEADQQIAEARSVHQKALTEMREEGERKTAKRKQEIAVQKEARKEQMSAKAETHASMQKRNAILSKKQVLLDSAYDSVVEKLGTLDAGKVEPLLRACIKQITVNGEIRPAEKHAQLIKKLAPSEQFRMGDPVKSVGGFLFVSEKEEQDFTFEHLVQHVLRPATELETSQALFS